MAERSYEVLHAIRVDQGGELKTAGDIIRLSDEDAKIALERGIVRELSEAVSSGRPDPSESSGIANQQNADNQTDDSGASNSPGTLDRDDEMVKLFGEDLAGDLNRGGYTSVEEVRGASEEELEAAKGIGAKSVRKIRAALGEGGAAGGM